MARFQLAHRLFVVAAVHPVLYRGSGSVSVFHCRIEYKFCIQDFPARLIFSEIGIDFFKTETGWQILQAKGILVFHGKEIIPLIRLNNDSFSVFL